MKKAFVIGAALAAILMGAGWALAAPAATAKIGWFEMNAVVHGSAWGKRAQADFEKQAGPKASAVKQKMEDFKKARDEFEKKKGVMDQKAKDAKMKELQAQAAEIQKLEADAGGTIGKLSTDLSKPIVDKVLEIVKRIAEADKYDFIFERGQVPILIYAAERHEITKRIIDELDKSAPK